MDPIKQNKEIDLMQYWGMIIKRKWVVITFLCATVLFTAIFTFLATPMYKSYATLLIEEETSKMLSVDETFGFQSAVIQDMRFFNTQLRILKSKMLAEAVARRLNLESSQFPGSASNPKKGLMNLVKNFFTLKWLRSRQQTDSENIGPEFISNLYAELAESISDRIEVKPIRETKLVQLGYSSPNPVQAADIVNTLCQEYMNFSINRRYERTQQASEFLNEQIADLDEELAIRERDLQRYGQESEIYDLSDAESTAVNQLSRLGNESAQAQIDRINAETTYRNLKDLDVDSLPQTIDNERIQQLKTEYANARNEYERLKKKYKPDFPSMVQLKASMDHLESELETELTNEVGAAETEYRSALDRENSLRRAFERQRANVAKMDSAAILYHSVKTEVDNKRRVINSLREKQNEALVSARLEGFEASNISIIDPAEVPDSPYTPKKKLNLILAFFIGSIGGISLCFILEYLDNTVKGPDDVEKSVGLPSLGVIPFLPLEGGKTKTASGNVFKDDYSYEKGNLRKEEMNPDKMRFELINHTHPQLPISEDYKTVRTSILLSLVDDPPKILAFTSAMPKEGKTATLVNTAVSFSQLDNKVLVIDADLRRPRLHHIFRSRNIEGLSTYLTGKTELEKAIQKTSVRNIWILPSGPIPPNPAELLESKIMKEMLKKVHTMFDVVLIDAPPVLAVIDPLVIASLVDATILVVRAGELSRKAFQAAVEEIRKTKTKIIGVIFNGLKVKRGDYYFMGYYRYSQYHYHEEQTSKGSDLKT